MISLLYASIAGMASIIGTLLVLRWRDWATEHSHAVNSLAAGLILGVAFLGLLPEALEMNDLAIPWVLVGFVAFYTLETFLVIHSGSEIHFHDIHEGSSKSKGWTIFTGLLLHSLIDGVIIGISFEASHQLGLLAAMSVVLHELPEGVTTFAILVQRIRKRTAVILSLTVGVATPVGALLGIVALPGLSSHALGALLAATANTFINVSASDLVPETHTHKGWMNAVTITAGVLLAFALSRMIHVHG